MTAPLKLTKFEHVRATRLVERLMSEMPEDVSCPTFPYLDYGDMRLLLKLLDRALAQPQEAVA